MKKEDYHEQVTSEIVMYILTVKEKFHREVAGEFSW